MSAQYIIIAAAVTLFAATLLYAVDHKSSVPTRSQSSTVFKVR